MDNYTHPTCSLVDCAYNSKGRCALEPGSSRLPDSSDCRCFVRRIHARSTEAVVRPFPGADARPDKLDGQLFVEGTQVPVARILAALAEESVLLDNEGDSRSKTVEDVAGDFDLDTIDVQECLRGLADWLKTQNWSGTKPTKLSSAETGCWVCGEELAGFRRWQDHRDQEKVEKDVPGARYAAMTPEEFIRSMADEGTKPRLGTSEADRLVVAWATRLSRALDVIERVTGERDACAKNGILRLQELAALHTELADTRVEADLLGRARGTLINIAEGYTAEGGPVEQAKKWLEADAQAIRTVIHLTPEASAKVDEMLRHPQEPSQALKDLMASAPESPRCNPGIQAVGGYRCPKCRSVFSRKSNVKGGVATCPKCKTSWADVHDKRCGNCFFGTEYRCPHVPIRTLADPSPRGVASGGYLTQDDGPPWDNCRFWKLREAK